MNETGLGKRESPSYLELRGEGTILWRENVGLAVRRSSPSSRLTSTRSLRNVPPPKRTYVSLYNPAL